MARASPTVVVTPQGRLTAAISEPRRPSKANDDESSSTADVMASVDCPRSEPSQGRGRARLMHRSRGHGRPQTQRQGARARRFTDMPLLWALLWTWTPGAGRTIPPLSHAKFMGTLEAFGQRGHAVPAG